MDINERIESLMKKQKFHNEQLDVIQKEIKQVKKENPLLTLLLKQWISVDIATLICNEYIDFNFCWKCKSMYSKYGYCLHKVLSGKQQSCQISAIDCDKLNNHDVEVAFPNARDKTIWQYLESQLFENHYSLKLTTMMCYNEPNTIRYNLSLVIHKIFGEKFFISLYDNKIHVYFAVAEKINNLKKK